MMAVLEGPLFEPSKHFRVFLSGGGELVYDSVESDQTDDAHPIHLHRNSFELTKVHGKPTAGILKDVVLVKGFKQIEVDVTPAMDGLSLFHCHHNSTWITDSSCYSTWFELAGARCYVRVARHPVGIGKRCATCTLSIVRPDRFRFSSILRCCNNGQHGFDRFLPGYQRWRTQGFSSERACQRTGHLRCRQRGRRRHACHSQTWVAPRVPCRIAPEAAV